jgi:hypothetical protein
MSLVPVPAEHAEPTCVNCGAALVADQRYCLSCGQPCSPVRLAFLDVLQSEHDRPAQQAPVGWGGANTFELAYAAGAYQPGINGWLRRYSGLLALMSVLAMCLIVGLLVGHWVSQSNGAAKQVVEVKGLSAPTAATNASPTGTNASGSTPGASPASSSSAKAEAQEAQDAVKETPAEKAPPPPPVKVKPQTIKKLTNSKGAQHQQEINKLVEGGKPIETG